MNWLVIHPYHHKMCLIRLQWEKYLLCRHLSILYSRKWKQHPHSLLRPGGGTAVLGAENAWKLDGQEIVAREVVTLRVHAAGKLGRAIDIELNRKSGFAAAGQSVNGSIRNEFGLEVRKHLVGSSLSGKVNNGGHKLKVETVNGSIEISKI